MTRIRNSERSALNKQKKKTGHNYIKENDITVNLQL